MNDLTRCGYVALAGRPNVGKSTLMNQLLGQKISITSRKPQTTRNRIVGIDTRDHFQALYVDTPGMHRIENRALNRFMNREAQDALRHVDTTVFLLDRTEWREEDELVANELVKSDARVIAVINKIDRMSDRDQLLPHIDFIKQKLHCEIIVPVSAKSGLNVDSLREAIFAGLPPGKHIHAEDQITTHSRRFLAAEIVREKIIRQLGQELPYKSAVEIEQFREAANTVHIHALIWVESAGQKKILIGRKGEKIKRIGSDARRDIEAMLENRVMLNLWVKVRDSWSDDERMIHRLGAE